MFVANKKKTIPRHQDQHVLVEELKVSENGGNDSASNIIPFSTVPPIAETATDGNDAATTASNAAKSVLAATPPQAAFWQLESLDEKQLEQYGLHLLLVTKIENGMKVRAAARAVNWNKSYRAAYDLWERYQIQGKTALFDHRWFRRSAAKVLIDEVKRIIYGWYLERRAAGPRAIWELATETCRQRKLPVPAETTVKAYLQSLTPNEKLARFGAAGFREIQKQHASVHEQITRAVYANELWQGDHTQLDIWVRCWAENRWTAGAVHLSVLLDSYSRAVPAALVSLKYPDSWSIALLYRKAVMKDNNADLNIYGLPFATQSDRGADWLSESVQTSIKALGIQPVIDPARYPNAKGKVERWFRTLNSSCLKKLPGHKDHVGRSLAAAQKNVLELPTFETVKREIEIWIAQYHQRVHGETSRKPLELWQETVHLRLPAHEEELNLLLLKYDKERTILNCGIRVLIGKEKHRYWSPTFDQLIKRRVRLRYNPEDTASVLVYCADSGQLLCEAWDMRADDSRYGLEDIKNARREEVRRLRGLVERSKTYVRQVTDDDRAAETEKHWQAVRETARELTAAATAAAAAAAETAAKNTPPVIDLAEELRRARRKQY